MFAIKWDLFNFDDLMELWIQSYVFKIPQIRRFMEPVMTFFYRREERPPRLRFHLNRIDSARDLNSKDKELRKQVYQHFHSLCVDNHHAGKYTAALDILETEVRT